MVQARNKVPVIATLAKQWLEKLEAEAKIDRNDFAEKSLTKQAAIDAVDRIFKYGKTETGRSLNDSLWFRDQLRLTADLRLKHLLTSGASQISKSLANYLVAIDILVSGRVNIGWFYASRQSMFNQQPEQFQKMALYWLQNAGMIEEINRESVTRYSVGNSVANFSYANSSTESKSGGAAEGKEQASFSVSALFLEERSSWKSLVDVTPRLGASLLPSKPIRELGTPGSGGGIERQMKDAAHLFYPAVFCPHCDRLTFLDPKGALLKSVKDKKTGLLRYFNTRGEILDYWSYDGTPQTAYIACLHCNSEIDVETIAQCRLHCRKAGISAEDFLNSLPDGKAYPESVAIYLSPLLRVSSDPFRVQELVKEGIEPQNPSIYQQNKLGHPSETDTTGVSINAYEQVLAMPSIILPGVVRRVAGLDQGRDSHWIVILEISQSSDEQIILLADAVGQTEIIPMLDRFEIDFALIDDEPDRLSTYDLCKASGIYEEFVHPLALQGFGYRLAMADQRSIDQDFKPTLVSHGSIQLPCYAISNKLMQDTIAASFIDQTIRISGKVHRKFQKHITSVKRDPDTGMWIRPADHDDHLWFALGFAQCASRILVPERKPVKMQTGITRSVYKAISDF